jgi:hypothetical protein
MSKLLESFLGDALQRVATPEAKAAIHTHILSPLLAMLLNALTPVLLVIGVVWGLLLLGIFVLLLRGIQKG